MRADRLVATLLLMKARGRVTADEVAAELEVSVATARRVFQALRSAGVPVCPQPGHRGGWSLVGGAGTDLNAAGATALLLLAGQWGLVNKNDVWHLVAGTVEGQRTFRVDRIGEAVLSDLVAERAAGFELSREGGRVVDEVEQRRPLLLATVLIPTRLLPTLRSQFGRHCEPLETLGDGRARVRVAAPMAISVAESLAGWGALVEVLEPDSVRAELARLGHELVARYGTD